MTMFKRISCVVLGAVTTSLISTAGAAHAFSLRSNNYNTFTNPGFSSSLSNQPAGFGTSDFDVSPPSLLSQGTPGETVGSNSALNELMAIGIVAWILWGLWNGDGDSNTIASNVMEPNNPGGSNNDVDNGGNNDMPAPIPTPALLPGLIGMGMAAIRKRNAAQAEQA